MNESIHPIPSLHSSMSIQPITSHSSIQSVESKRRTYIYSHPPRILDVSSLLMAIIPTNLDVFGPILWTKKHPFWALTETLHPVASLNSISETNSITSIHPIHPFIQPIKSNPSSNPNLHSSHPISSIHAVHPLWLPTPVTSTQWLI